MNTNTFTDWNTATSAQTTNRILMVRPANFGFNPETAIDNVFQQPVARGEKSAVAQAAIAEFDGLVDKLKAAGVEVIVVEDTEEPAKPDAVFPNNWITTHDDGVIVTYSMLSDNRRLERRPEIVDYLAENFSISRLIRLEGWEEQDMILEGTGSMILDRVNRIVYCSLSQRADAKALEEWAATMRFEVCAFNSVGLSGKPIYHTNVLMALGTTHAVICLEIIPDADQRRMVIDRLRATGKEIVEIAEPQVDQFAGNMIELIGAEGPVWVMSTSAYDSLRPEQIAALENGGRTKIIHSDLSTIETHGGGSARCMIAEIFLQERE